MRQHAYLLIIIVLYSCKSDTHKLYSSDSNIKVEPIIISELEALKFNPRIENHWIYTRIFPKSQINDKNEVYTNTKDSSVLLKYNYIFHKPRVFDDIYWEELFIYIPDTSKIKTKTIYTIPNNFMTFKYVKGGAWVDITEFSYINGQIRFETFNYDSTLVSLKLNGAIYDKNNMIWFGNLMCEKLTFLKSGRPDWELKDELE